MLENDAGTYVIAIFCDGPTAAARHDRFVVIAYGRLQRDDSSQGRSWVPVRKWTGADGRLTRARNHDTHAKKSGPANSYLLDAGLPHLHYQYRFRCSRCGLDEQRKYGPDIDAIFDRLADNNIHEISVRAFVSFTWGR